MDKDLLLILWCAVGYLSGSIPFGLILCSVCGYGDIRKSGSGNIGATNVLRVTKNKLLALLTILLDASKAGLVAYIALLATSNRMVMFCGMPIELNVLISLFCGTLAVLGHNFPIWLKFKGGKGVASSFGLIMFLRPFTALAALVVWIVMAVVFRYSSLAAIVAALVVPFISFFYNDTIYTIFFAFLSLLLLVRHRSNIVRLLRGEESKISFGKSKNVGKK